MRALLKVVTLWRPSAGWLAAGLLVSLLATGAGTALLVLAAYQLEQPLRGGGEGGVVLVAGLTLAAAVRSLGVARALLRYLERLVTHAATFRALANLRVWLFRRLGESAAGGLGFMRSGDVLARLGGDVDALDVLYLRVIVPLAAGVLLLPTVALLIGTGNTALALVVTGLLGIATFLLPWMAATRALRAGASLASTAAALRVATLDALSGMREVRAFGAEGRMLAAMQAREAALFRAQREVAARASRANALAFLCGQAGVLAVLLLADASAAAVLPAVLLTATAFEVVGGLPRAGTLAGHAAAAAARVLSAAEAPRPVPDPVQPSPVPAGSDLRFDRVSFRWRPDHAPVFEDLTLDIPAGSRIAILGPSGSGKSTLAALVLKVVAPQSGRILLGGIDLAGLAAEDVRARIAWLSQATHLFDDTIRENLRLAKPAATDEELWAALDRAALGDTVRSLPDGLGTWVGEGGARFSGGQGRRLALARTLLSNSPILILDEPAAGLDAATEQAFLRTLNDVTAGRTVILIAHRLTGTERLDRIWRLSGGTAMAAAA